MDVLSSNLRETLDAIDLVIEARKADIKLGEKLARLMANTDFIDVILEGYIGSEERKLFQILTDPSGSSPYSNDQVMLKLASISDFKGYVGTKDFPGTVKMAAINAPSIIDREELYRKEATAQYASSEG